MSLFDTPTYVQSGGSMTSQPSPLTSWWTSTPTYVQSDGNPSPSPTQESGWWARLFDGGGCSPTYQVPPPKPATYKKGGADARSPEPAPPGTTPTTTSVRQCAPGLVVVVPDAVFQRLISLRE